MCECEKRRDEWKKKAAQVLFENLCPGIRYTSADEPFYLDAVNVVMKSYLEDYLNGRS